VDDPWRMARLRWLDSTLGIDRNITTEFNPVHVVCNPGCTVSISNNRTVAVGAVTPHAGLRSDAVEAVVLLDSIMVGDVVVLAEPLQLQATGLTWTGATSVLTQHDNMTATIVSTATSSDGAIVLNCSTVVHFDGFVDTVVALQTAGAHRNVTVNVTVSSQVSAAASTYFMGLGLAGRNRTAAYPTGQAWRWSTNTGAGRNQLWTGAVNAGLRLKFKGDSFDWESPLHVQDAPPASWGGDLGTGGITAMPAGDQSGALDLVAYTRPVTVTQSGVSFRFDALVTPVKPLETARHFNRDRYYQYGCESNPIIAASFAAVRCCSV
jgi:hypothetical protein